MPDPESTVSGAGSKIDRPDSPLRPRRLVLRAALSHYALLGSQTVLGPLQLALAVRYLGVAHYGIWATVTAIASYASLSRAGATGAIVTLLPQTENQQQQRWIARQLVGLSVVSSTSLVALAALAFTLRPALFGSLFRADLATQLLAAKVLMVAVAFTVVRAPLLVAISLFAGLNEVWWQKLHVAASNVLSLLALLVTMAMNGNVVFLAWAWGGGAVVEILAIGIHLRLRHAWLFGAPSDTGTTPAIGRRLLLRTSTRYLALNIVYTIVQRTDYVLISALLGPAFVSPYAITQRLYSFLLAAAEAAHAPMWPLFGSLVNRRDWASIDRYLRQLCAVSVASGGAILILGIGLAEPVVRMWVGSSGYAGATVSSAFAVTTLVALFVGACGTLVHALNPSPTIIAMAAAEAALNVGLSLLLVGPLGLLGVALGTLSARLATMFWFAPVYVIARTKGKVGFAKGSLVAMAAGALSMGGALFLLDQSMSLSWQAHLGFTIIALLLYSIGVLRYNPSLLRTLTELAPSTASPPSSG